MTETPSTPARRLVEAFGDATYARTTTFSYAADDQVVSVINPRGYKSTSVYDELGRLSTVTDAQNGVATYAYDKLDRLVSFADPLDHRTTFGYDELSRNVTITDPRGKVTTNVYDKLDRLTT